MSEVFDCEGMKNWMGHRCATEEVNITNWYNIDGLKSAWGTVKLTPMKKTLFISKYYYTGLLIVFCVFSSSLLMDND